MKAIERIILNTLITRLQDAGYEVATAHVSSATYVAHRNGAFYETDQPPDLAIPIPKKAALELIQSFDDPFTLHFTHQDKLTWGNRGVFIVPGNGESIISDWHDPSEVEPFSDIIQGVVDAIDSGGLIDVQLVLAHG